MATQFRILGRVEALVDGEAAALGAPKQRALLALLLVKRRRVVTPEQLVDWLWGASPPASALQSLQVYVHGLRRAVGAERIETAGRGYRAVVAEDELDLDRFERMLERGRAPLEAGHADDAADGLREALAIWRSRHMRACASSKATPAALRTWQGSRTGYWPRPASSFSPRSRRCSTRRRRRWSESSETITPPHTMRR